VATPTQTVPRNSGELEEMLHDPKKRGEILASEKSLTDFITAYGEQQQGDGTDLNRLVAEETQKQLAAYLKDKDVDNDNADRIKRLNLDPQNKGRGGKASMLTSYGQGAAHNAHAPGAVLDGKFETAVDYLNTIWHLNNKPDVQAKLAEIRNAASGVPGGRRVPGAGGAPVAAAADLAGEVGGAAAGDRGADGLGAGAVPDDRRHLQRLVRVRRDGGVLG
jgi:hypothetical protein